MGRVARINHDRPVTEAEYMAAYRAQRSADSRPHKAHRYATAKLRGTYRNLQEDFGFFGPLENRNPTVSMEAPMAASNGHQDGSTAGDQ